MNEKVTICKLCGFPKEWERDIIILNNNIDGLMQVVHDEDFRCPECKHYKDGSTIKKLKPLLKKYKELGERNMEIKFKEKLKKNGRWNKHKTFFKIPGGDFALMMADLKKEAENEN